MSERPTSGTGLGSKPVIAVVIAVGLIAAIGVSVFILWRRMSTASVDSKIMSNDLAKTKIDVSQLLTDIKSRDEKISNQQESISKLEKEVYHLQQEVKKSSKRSKSEDIEDI